MNQNRGILFTYFFSFIVFLSIGCGGSDSNNSNVNISGDYTNDVGMVFKYIPPGTFMMGSPYNEKFRFENETQHQVTLTSGFYIMVTEVTQKHWRDVTGSNPAHFSSCGDNCPVEMVSYNDIQSLIVELNNLGDGTYRLPTEAEWEYACRAGTTTAFANGDITEYSCQHPCTLDQNLNQMAWYCCNSNYTTHQVAQKSPNAWGLYDMHGNVLELCSDYYDVDYGLTDPTSAVTDPTGPSADSLFVVLNVARGGSYKHDPSTCRSAGFRYYFGVTNQLDYLGFRLVLSIEQ